MFLDYHGAKPSRNNPGQSNENGSVEKSHDLFKHAMDQRLRLRQSRDFKSLADYESFLRVMVRERNRLRKERLEQEVSVLLPLPDRDWYEPKEDSVQVTGWSTVSVDHKIYSVPSRFIGQTLRALIYHDSVELLFGKHVVLNAEKPSGTKCINYRHLITHLMRKPGAFRNPQELKMPTVLLVEDDLYIRQLIKVYLHAEGHFVDEAETGSAALAHLKLADYDLILLDWMLPDLTGVEICQKYRDKGGTALVMMLTSRKDKYDKVTALDAGADDYLVKPIDQMEFQARVRALLRQRGSWGSRTTKITIRDLEVDTVKQTVVRNGMEIELRPREYLLLEFLMKHPGQSFTAEALFARLWKTDSVAAQETVRMHIMALRKKLMDEAAPEPLIKYHEGVVIEFATSRAEIGSV